MIDKITAIILAGGKSSRMGQDKSFLELAGKPLIKITIDTLSEIFKSLLIITNNPEPYKTFGIRVAGDSIKDCGPLGGIYTGLTIAETTNNFIVACDMPFLNKELIYYMVKEIQDYDVVVPEFNGRLEPLCAIYSKNCIKPIENQIFNQKLKVTDFFKSLKVRVIKDKEIKQFDPEGLYFTNINTREDCRRLKYERI